MNDIREERKIKMLWVSPMAPYNAVPHAGGKTHNHYTKSFANDSRFQVKLLTYCTAEEESVVRKEFRALNMETELVVHPYNRIGKLFWKCLNAETVLNPFNRYAGMTKNHIAIRMIKRLKKLAVSGYVPDVIFLHWTQINLLAKQVKKIFPESKLIEMEVDVSYLAYERRMKGADGFLKRKIWEYKMNKLKKLELDSLRLCELIIVNNEKDAALLQKERLSIPVFQWSPYYLSFMDCKRKACPDKTILFYGAMNREENWRSAVWFIENVFCKIEDPKAVFCVVGGNPVPQIKKYESERIHILGYVDDLNKIFSESMCLVAPLVLGAGIKVKIIEGFSAGIPVLTNQIGIEGIPAKDRVHYFHCETPDDYIKTIHSLLAGEIDLKAMENEEKALIKNCFSFVDDAVKLHNRIYDLFT